MKRILIAYDGTPGANDALLDLRGAGLSKRVEARILTIADVWIPPASTPGAVDMEANPTYEKAAEVIRNSRKVAIEGARRVHELFPDWTVTNVTKADSPAWGIVAEAKRWNADLIVIGSHGRSALERYFLGSVSFKVAAEAPCSVRIARARATTSLHQRRIVAALDGSQDATRMLEELAARDLSHTKVELVTVIDEKLKTTWMGRSDLEIKDTVEEEIRNFHRSVLSKFTAANVQAEFHIFDGEPKTILLRVATDWNADCIFLGARGLDHGNRLYLGTLASAISTRAHCTVEVVR
jgi:nucleotide-binding universal stress UspA family protein